MTTNQTETQDFLDEDVSQDSTQKDAGELLDFDSFTQGNGSYIKNPPVGESVEIVIKRIEKMKARRVTPPKGGRAFDVKLSGVDYYYDLVSPEDKRYSCVYWKIVGQVKAIARKLKTIEGLEIKIEHAEDGFANKNAKEIYKVYAKVNGEYKRLNKETNEWS
jgi:hypothetical protein